MVMKNQTVLITGAARRIGRHLALAVAEAGGNVIIHHANSPEAAAQTAADVQARGVQAWVLTADFNDPRQVQYLMEQAAQIAPLFAVINNASIYEPLSAQQTALSDWQRHLNVNLTAPFLICQAFAALPYNGPTRRILNILDWRALRPAADHFPYIISKAALTAMTRSLAVTYAPNILVNGLALGAILPPSDGSETTDILKSIPAGRWAHLDEVNQSAIFLLDGPEYITGEILHLDGGRQLI
jgi:NAD(P)-dependent dehydrogenase (short-subunit alcohol dehydrogenase family)